LTHTVGIYGEHMDSTIADETVAGGSLMADELTCVSQSVSTMSNARVNRNQIWSS